MEALRKALETLGLPADEQTVNKYQQYMEGVLDWNEKVNLTNITDPEEFVIKHFIDSIICACYPEFEEAQKIIPSYPFHHPYYHNRHRRDSRPDGPGIQPE